MITVNGQVYDGIMIKPELDDLLEHHGVKGQKWGIRKQRPTLGLARRRVRTVSSKVNYATEGKKYDKYYNKASRQKDRANELWKEADKKYKKLGKTRLTRLIRSAKGKTAEAKEYSKAYDRASAADDVANESWKKAKKQYNKLGKTRVSRTIRAIKYSK